MALKIFASVENRNTFMVWLIILHQDIQYIILHSNKEVRDIVVLRLIFQFLECVLYFSGDMNFDAYKLLQSAQF